MLCDQILASVYIMTFLEVSLTQNCKNHILGMYVSFTLVTTHLTMFSGELIRITYTLLLSNLIS